MTDPGTAPSNRRGRYGPVSDFLAGKVSPWDTAVWKVSGCNRPDVDTDACHSIWLEGERGLRLLLDHMGTVNAIVITIIAVHFQNR